MSFDQRAGGTQFPNLLQPVQRALRILEVIAESPDGIPAKAIARRLNLASSTTYHILHTLVAEGYVVRLDGVRGFGLGYRIPALNRDLRSKLGSRRRSRPPLRRFTGAPPPTTPSTATGRW